MIRSCEKNDLPRVLSIINDAAEAYREAIPVDCWHEPYMTMDDLVGEISDGVKFSGFEGEDGALHGVMGMQDRGEVVLIRHAYVRTEMRRNGIGTALLSTLRRGGRKPILMGTWKAADWAIDFYTKQGFRLVDEESKNRLLRKYWTIPDRQIETSVVLVEEGHGV